MRENKQAAREVGLTNNLVGGGGNKSHTWIVVSKDPETMCFPSGEQAMVLDCYDVSVQPQTHPRSSLTFVRRYTLFVAYTPKPHGHNLCATISLLVLSYCPYVFCVDCSYLWATGHASYCSDHVYRCDEQGGERSSRFYRPLTRCARYANYVYISRFYCPLTHCASLTDGYHFIGMRH